MLQLLFEAIAFVTLTLLLNVCSVTAEDKDNVACNIIYQVVKSITCIHTNHKHNAEHNIKCI